MNSSSCCSDKTKSLFAWFIAVVGTFLLLGALTVWLRGPDASAPDAARAVERKKLLAEVRAVAHRALDPVLRDLVRGHPEQADFGTQIDNRFVGGDFGVLFPQGPCRLPRLLPVPPRTRRRPRKPRRALKEQVAVV